MPDSATELLDPPVAQTDAQAGEGIASESGTADGATDEVIAADLLVEEISIDGMCGVY
ncbi:MAG TPA: mycofactocin precursor MftA [Streptosporangiaceae bacterium]|jgi:mycofactocin precursor